MSIAIHDTTTNKGQLIWTDIKQEFISANWKITLVLIFNFLAFNNLLEYFIQSIMIDKVFYFMSAGKHLDWFIITTALILFVVYIKRFNKYTPSTTNLIVISILAVAYFYYRFLSNHWGYLTFFDNKKIAYLDLFFIYWLAIISSWGRQFPYSKEKKPTVFNEDTPLSELNTEDYFSFGNYAEEIAKKIKVGTYEKSFAIGVSGSWGSGKSSLTHLILKHLDDRNHIKIKFNPWASQTPQALIKDFFEQVSAELKPYNETIGKLSISYAKKLVTTDDTNVFAKIIDGTFSDLNDDTSIEKYQKNIDEALRKISKKLIIVIDDIDRLSFEEVAEVFKLVRNTANFPNTVFLLLYDRNYVSKAISDINATNSDLFLEKIVQLEISIPFYEKRAIKEKLKEKLIFHFNNIDEKDIDGSLVYKESFVHDYVSDWICNLRDVNRLVNSVILNYEGLEDEVYFKDFLKLEILRLKLPNIYNLFKNDPWMYLKEIEHSSDRQIIAFKHVDADDKKEFIISQKVKEFHKDDEIKAMRLVTTIFVDKRPYGNIHPLSIVNPSNFNRYFRYSISNKELSTRDFTVARESGLDAMKAKIDVWYSNNLTKEIKQKFEEIYFYNNDEDYDLVIKSILYFANKRSQGFGGKDILVGYNDYDFISKLYLYENDDRKEKREKYREYFFKIMNNINKVLSYELLFLNTLACDLSDDFILSKEELKKLLIEKLSELSKNMHTINQTFWDLYRLSEIKVWTSHAGSHRSHKELMPELHPIFIDILERTDIKQILSMVTRTSFPKKGTLAINMETIKYFWSDIEDFKKFVTKSRYKNQSEVDKFFGFLEETEKVGYTPIETSLNFD